MHERLDIGTSAAAAAFAGERSRAVLLALAAQEQSLRQLAARTGMRLNLLHYHVARLQALGLIEIVRSEKRPGRPVKIYRSVARAFFVPARLVGGEVGDKLSAELRQRLASARARSAEGALYFVDDDGGPRMRLIGDERADGTELWSLLHLSRTDAAELAAEMKSLLGRYRSLEPAAGRPYLVHAALAPR
jgi:hypothetical protein